MKDNWLWDRKISEAAAKKILKNPGAENFLAIAALSDGVLLPPAISAFSMSITNSSCVLAMEVILPFSSFMASTSGNAVEITGLPIM